METNGKASSRERQEKRSPGLPCVAWSCAIATVVLALATAAAASAGEEDEATSSGHISRAAAAAAPSSINVTAICRSTPYPSACEKALSSSGARSSGDPFAASVQFAMVRAASAHALAHNLSASSMPPPRGAPPSGMVDCAELLDISVHQLRDALAGSARDADGATTWLSAALTNQGTCRDSLAAVPAAAGREAMRRQVAALAKFISTALALHVAKARDGSGSQSSAAPAPAPNGSTSPFPPWVSEHDRRLLESPFADVTPDALVALDGSGTHRSIGDAIAAVTAAALAPPGTAAIGGGCGGGGRRAAARKVIHVKAGRYEETVSISNSQTNVMLLGDGKGKTVIVGSKSAGDGYTTFASATVAAMGAGFIARGLSIVNSAGPGKGQAVALLVGGDRSVVYRCSIEGHQDTLCAHSNRQLFAEDDIAGTVDFIFGNAAAVVQRCRLAARRPGPGQVVVVTAQGREDPNQNTGLSLHRCRLAAAPDLGGAPVFLGRPWRARARVVVMGCALDAAVAPAGWLRWSSETPATSTVYYGEYGNTGPGAATRGRVTWSGVHTWMSAAEAMEFTVGRFISGGSWLGSTGVRYISGL
ncbi:hypothetical protein ACP4OV_000814 [Aristida adscensionis]